MKKVMVGILILIPVIILVVVALVSTIISLQAWIAVEDMQIYYKDTQEVAEFLELKLTQTDEIQSFEDYFDVEVMPEKANRYTISWQITGEITYTHKEYEDSYLAFLEESNAFNVKFDESYEGFENSSTFTNTGEYFDEIRDFMATKPFKPYQLDTEEQKASLKEEARRFVKDLVLEEVPPAIMLVDENGNEVESNANGNFIINSYCTFTLRVEAEHISRVINVSVGGDTVEGITLINVNEQDDNVLTVGESMRIEPVYNPIDSVVANSIWWSDNEAVASVDESGVITAHGVGTANIYIKASIHGSDEDDGEFDYLTCQNPYQVSVQAGASSIFGDSITIANTYSTITIGELGISGIESVEGGSIDGGLLTIDESAQEVVITLNNGKTFKIKRCAPNAIGIVNAAVYAHKEEGNSYVLAVGDDTIRLRADYLDALATGEPMIDWTSSNASVATINAQGVVTPVGSGLVTITATQKGTNNKTSIILNVQNKLASLQLKTSNAALAVGIARETVFASERFSDSTCSEIVANYTHIVVQGEPKDASASELKAFYDAFNFEVVSGAEYAEFDSVIRNRLVFKDTLEGMGKQNIEIKVSARYPKYEGATNATTKFVIITAIYGIEVNNINEMRAGADVQAVYVKQDGNFIDNELYFDHTVEETGDRYIVFSAQTSHKDYAIVLASNVAYEVSEDDNPLIITKDNNIKLRGSLYGNNYMFSARTGQCEDKLLHVFNGNLTISNVILRVNSIDGEDANVEGSDLENFIGECMKIGNEFGHREHYFNVNIEYSIFENAKMFAMIYGSDVNINGCIIRNMLNTGFWVEARMHGAEDEDIATYPCEGKLYYTRYSHVNINNTIASNTIGTFCSIQYYDFAKKGSGEYRFSLDKDEAKARELSRQYFEQHFASKGINNEITQTGFLDVYNWQNVDNAQLINIGNKESDKFLNSLIGSATGPMIKYNSAFDRGRIEDEANQVTYFHLGMILTGTGGGGIVSEPNYSKMSFEDNRFYCLSAREIKVEEDIDGVGAPDMVEELLSKMEIQFYGYSADNGEILPDTTYTVDSALIAHLHGEK